MDKCGNFVTLTDDTQYAVFNVMSDLIYKISELESRGKLHLAHLKKLRREMSFNFKPTRNIKRLRMRPGVYESLITNIDLIDFTEASERGELEDHFLDFSGRGPFSIPRIPPPTEITKEYIRLWNEFYTCKNKHRPKRGKRKKPNFDNLSLFIAENHYFFSKTPVCPLINKSSERKGPIVIPRTELNDIHDAISVELQSSKRILFDLINNKSCLLEWATTRGFNFEELNKIHALAVPGKSKLVIDEFVKELTLPKHPRKYPVQTFFPELEEEKDVELILDIPILKPLEDKLEDINIIRLRRRRFGPNRIADNYSLTSLHEDLIELDDLQTAIEKKREFFTMKMSLYFNVLEGMHYIHKHLSNAVSNLPDSKRKEAAEAALASISILEDQYCTVFKENVLIKPTKYVDSKRMRNKMKMLTLASMIISTPPCDSELLTNIFYELGAFTPLLKKSKTAKQLTSMIDLPQKSLIKRCNGHIYKTEGYSSIINVVFPTWLELMALDLPSELFAQHKSRVGDSFLYNSGMMLENLLNMSSTMAFTI